MTKKVSFEKLHYLGGEMISRRWVLLVLFIMLLSSLACAGSNNPSDDSIKTAISEMLKVSRYIPVSSDSAMGGPAGQPKNVQIDIIEIKQIGNFNKDGKYLPVKARYKGNCNLGPFDNVWEFKIRKDDYGTWKADGIQW